MSEEAAAPEPSGAPGVPEASLVEGLLSAYGTDVDTFDVVLPKGERLRFRQFRSYGELNRFNTEAAAFARLVTGKRSQVKEEWWPHLPDDKEAAITAYTIHAMSVEPRFDQLQALKLLSAPWLVSQLMRELNARRMNYLAERFSEEVEEGKGDSGRTGSTGHA